jgi:hypothetical protein
MRQKITEEMKVHEEWYKTARNEEMSMEKLTELIRHLTEDYEHDYGTIVHACTAASIAALRVVNASDQGGITGFQAGAIMWEFIRHWNRENNKCGLKLMDYDNMLYPQYDYHFEKTISKETWEALQKEAKINLDKRLASVEKDTNGNPEYNTVMVHWKSIIDGNIPFGYVIEDKE